MVEIDLLDSKTNTNSVQMIKVINITNNQPFCDILATLCASSTIRNETKKKVVIDLSLKFQVLSPLTAFFANAGT
jgi:hypothetical protein